MYCASTLTCLPPWQVYAKAGMPCVATWTAVPGTSLCSFQASMRKQQSMLCIYNTHVSDASIRRAYKAQKVSNRASTARPVTADAAQFQYFFLCNWML